MALHDTDKPADAAPEPPTDLEAHVPFRYPPDFTPAHFIVVGVDAAGNTFANLDPRYGADLVQAIKCLAQGFERGWDRLLRAQHPDPRRIVTSGGLVVPPGGGRTH